MTTPDPLWLKTRVTYARAATEIVIADCDAAIAQRVHAQIDEAREKAKSFRSLANDYNKLMTHLDGFEDLPAEVIAVLRPGIDLLAEVTGSLWSHFEEFARRHTLLVDEDLEDRLRRGTTWVAELQEVVGPKADQYIAELEAGLEEVDEENAAQTQEWDVVVETVEESK